MDPALHRAMPCPRAGCDEWAIIATTKGLLEHGADLWRCGAGHHGPRLVGWPSTDARTDDSPEDEVGRR